MGNPWEIHEKCKGNQWEHDDEPLELELSFLLKPTKCEVNMEQLCFRGVGVSGSDDRNLKSLIWWFCAVFL